MSEVSRSALGKPPAFRNPADERPLAKILLIGALQKRNRRRLGYV